MQYNKVLVFALYARKGGKFRLIDIYTSFIQARIRMNEIAKSGKFTDANIYEEEINISGRKTIGLVDCWTNVKL